MILLPLYGLRTGPVRALSVVAGARALHTGAHGNRRVARERPRFRRRNRQGPIVREGWKRCFQGQREPCWRWGLLVRSARVTRVYGSTTGFNVVIVSQWTSRAD